MASRAESERALAAFAPRPVCSEAERRAAVWAHDDLRARGHEAWLETHWVRPHLATAIAIDCALAAGGGLLAVAVPVAGLVVAALGTLALLLDLGGRTGLPRLLLPRRATQVVLVAPAGRTAAAVDLLLVARTDVPRAALAGRLRRLRGGLWWLALPALAVTAAAAARVAGAGGLPLGAAQFAATVLLVAAIGGALDAATGRIGPGGDEDGALATALDVHERLVREPAAGVAAGLLLAPPQALLAHLRAERLPPARTALLHVRAGDVRSRHPQWRAAAAAAELTARKGGPRGLPAAVAPPDEAERLARGLGETL